MPAYVSFFPRPLLLVFEVCAGAPSSGETPLDFIALPPTYGHSLYRGWICPYLFSISRFPLSSLSIF